MRFARLRVWRDGTCGLRRWRYFFVSYCDLNVILACDCQRVDGLRTFGEMGKGDGWRPCF
jgi:hypothetical protein